MKNKSQPPRPIIVVILALFAVLSASIFGLSVSKYGERTAKAEAVKAAVTAYPESEASHYLHQPQVITQELVWSEITYPSQSSLVEGLPIIPSPFSPASFRYRRCDAPDPFCSRH